MKTVKLVRGEQNGEEIILINFDPDPKVESHLIGLPGLKRNNSNGKFHLKNSAKNLGLLFNHLRKIKCYVDYSELSQKQVAAPVKRKRLFLPPIDSFHKEDLMRFRKWLEEKRLSPHTVNTYVEVTHFFVRYSILKKSKSYTKHLVESFNYEFIVCEGKSVSYQNQCINGIKKYFLFKDMDIGTLDLIRPKKERKLPVVLSKMEVRLLMDVTHNLKHRTLLALIYSGGLRIGEAINLKVDDIDSKRMLIHIKGGKGKKDRYTLLSQSFLETLRQYYKQYKPKAYLFEGQNSSTYSRSSAQWVLKNAILRAGIRKEVTLHTLRHSFATHLLENGTDIRYIQELLGHSSPKTTMIYTHVTENSIKNISNPFDDL
ncbi:tyrosine-type recombinase/integrase [Muricauda sp. 334s03]|uniref:Tyrosine-type recombinase/integrase n=1 Tax=Flagellimonas yonaguniensis TaxID=3031325 RepID=A0ABT5Y1H4_9FLAO|nr:tyrosine-type recombinase/integrase [[Muricauda] yonaguniensis]MDF0717296.1 tyrosine-type recombinase/integrase [[Muricauda] yonaguniensis]